MRISSASRAKTNSLTDAKKLDLMLWRYGAHKTLKIRAGKMAVTVKILPRLPFVALHSPWSRRGTVRGAVWRLFARHWHQLEKNDLGRRRPWRASSYEIRYRARVIDNLHRRAKAFGLVLQRRRWPFPRKACARRSKSGPTWPARSHRARSPRRSQGAVTETTALLLHQS